MRLLLLVLAAAGALAATFDITAGGQDFATTLPSTPLDGSALVRVCEACAADVQCRDIFEFGGPGGDYTLCAFLIQQAQPFGAGPYTLEMSIVQALDGLTVDQVIDKEWVRALVLGAQTTFACYNSEHYVLSADGLSGKCVARGNESVSSPWRENLVIGIGIGLLIFWAAGSAIRGLYRTYFAAPAPKRT